MFWTKESERDLKNIVVEYKGKKKGKWIRIKNSMIRKGYKGLTSEACRKRWLILRQSYQDSFVEKRDLKLMLDEIRKKINEVVAFVEDYDLQLKR